MIGVNVTYILNGGLIALRCETSLLVGNLLKAYLAAFKIRQNKFADYIGIRPCNLSKFIEGERSLNHGVSSCIRENIQKLPDAFS